jgi:hypothetical protein
VPDDPHRPQLGQPHHCAYLVADIESTVSRLVEQLGAGPFFLIERVPLEDVTSRGEPAEFVHDSAFGLCGDGAIELIQTVSLAPERVEKGFGGSRPRIHHVAYVAPAVEVAGLRSRLDQQGMTQYLSSQLGGVETTLHDGSATFGHDLEIHVDNPALHDFFGMVRLGAVGWDGSEPLRPVGT